MDLNNSVVIPRDDFQELQEAAYNQPPATLKQGAITAASTTMVMAGIGAVVVASSWGWAKAVDWLETRRTARSIAENESTKISSVK